MSFCDFVKKVSGYALITGTEVPVYQNEDGRYSAVFPDGLTVFGNSIAPSLMFRTASGRLFRARV